MFIISRRLNNWNDLDYLQEWDAKHGTSCSLAAHTAMGFETRGEAQQAKARCERLVPTWMSGQPIEYAIETYRGRLAHLDEIAPREMVKG